MEVEVDLFLEAKPPNGDEEFEEHIDEVEQATDFLQNTGLSNLSKIHQEGKEITDSMLNSSIRAMNLSEKQAETVKQRIRTLNKTIHNRQPRRKLRQDVREVAWNIETSSTGTRSRSATPDSLDSVEGNPDELLTSDEDQQMSNFSTGMDLSPKAKVKWTLSEPIPSVPSIPFNRADRKKNVAHSGSDGVVLKGYQLLDETEADSLLEIEKEKEKKLSTSHNNLFSIGRSEDYDESSSKEAISFEGICRQSSPTGLPWQVVLDNGQICVETITDIQYQHLKPLLWLELTVLFDQYNIACYKRKPNMRKRKEKQGNVFGVPLSTLVMRDMQTDSSMVPQVFKSILLQLETRCLKEEGILRLSGQKQKIENLCSQIENYFYISSQQTQSMLNSATCHELSAVLKKLLRELPESIFTVELAEMFYKCHAISVPQDQTKAISLLILLLPVEYRNTLRAVVSFLRQVIDNSTCNRMTLHNVSAIIAPSLFPSKWASVPDEKAANPDAALAITTIAFCCKIIEIILNTGDYLWSIPSDLLAQAVQHKPKKIAKTVLHRSNTQYQAKRNDCFL